MRAHIRSLYLDDDGIVNVGQYGNGSLALTFTGEDGEPLSTLSINLEAYGLVPPEGHIFVKNYAESEGLAAGLEAAGIAEPRGTVTFGPYDTTATLMLVTMEVS
jgi:hypothetical protein